MIYSSHKICLEWFPFPFLSTAQVNLNGVLSINSNFSSTNTKEFPISDTPPFIAGFWDQISLKKNGRPYGVIAYIEMNNSSELFQSYKARYKSFLGERFGKCIEQFQPTHIFLATWKDAVQTSSVSNHIHAIYVLHCI